MADAIRFFLDQHIPAAVAEGLRNRGIDVLSAQDAGRCGFADSEQLQYALAEGRVVVTFDDDYLTLAAAGTEHAGIAYAPATKYSVGQLIYALLLVHGVLTPEDMRNHVEFL